MSSLELVDIVSMDPDFSGKPTPDVLKCFQIRIFRDPTDGTLSLSVDFCTHSLLVCKEVARDEIECHIRSLQWGLRLGHAAAGYVKKGGAWVPKSKKADRFI